MTIKINALALFAGAAFALAAQGLASQALAQARPAAADPAAAAVAQALKAVARPPTTPAVTAAAIPPARPAALGCEVDNDTDPTVIIAACDRVLASTVVDDAQRFDLVVARGYARVRQQRFTEAMVDFDRALGMDTHSAFLRHERAFALNGLGQYQAALVELEAEEKLLPQSPRVPQERAFSYARMGELIESRRAWDRVVTLAPNDGRARLGRASAALWTGDFAQARADVAALQAKADPALAADLRLFARRLSLVSAAPSAPGKGRGVRDPQARCLTPDRTTTSLIADCTAAFLSAGSATDRAAALSARAAAWDTVGDRGQAMEDTETAVAIDPANGRGQANLGFRLLAAGRAAESLARFNEAVRLDPSVFALAGRARARFELGDDLGAASDARASNDRQPNDLAFIVLGDQAYRADDAAQARTAWLTAYRLGYRGADLMERLNRAGVANPERDAAALR